MPPTAPNIQRVETVDAALAAALNAQFDEDMAWDAAQGARFLANPANLLLVARWQGGVCGFLTAYRLQRVDRRRAEVLLYEIGVDERFQRRGVGRALVEACKAWATEVGAAELWVLTEADNEGGMGLYAATGGVADPPGTTLFAYDLEGTGAADGA